LLFKFVFRKIEGNIRLPMQTEGYEPRESDNRLEMRASLSEAILQSEEIPASERHKLTQAVAAMSETELREALALLRKDKASMLR
jgi:hypothetical protein